MKFRCRGCVFIAVIILALVRLSARGATDPEIDRLLKKLPPPEKLVKADQRVVRVNDPALRDPILKEIETAAREKKPTRCLELSQQLAAHYPSSAAAHAYCGLFALDLRRYPESVAAFKHALSIQPDFVLCHYCLASAEWKRNNPAAALPHLRQVTKLEPRAAAGWAFLSVCAETVGQLNESVVAARHLVELEPQQTAAWFRLAIAEKNVGNYNAAVAAINRATATAQAARSTAHKSASSKKKN